MINTFKDCRRLSSCNSYLYFKRYFMEFFISFIYFIFPEKYDQNLYNKQICQSELSSLGFTIVFLMNICNNV